MRKDYSILYIDDDHDDQIIFAETLSGIEAPIEIRFCNDGEEAVDLLSSDQEYTPTHIFLDLNMPKMNGKNCLKELRQIKRLNDVPIIIYSTSTGEEWAELKQLGASAFLTKPSVLKAIKQRIEMVLFNKIAPGTIIL